MSWPSTRSTNPSRRLFSCSRGNRSGGGGAPPRRSPQPDVDAAIDIARTPGRRVVPPFDVRPTPGEVRDIQRRSRLDSAGQVTISSELADAVARVVLSLEEAIARARRKEPRSKG